jgi:hypothetical protein
MLRRKYAHSVNMTEQYTERGTERSRGRTKNCKQTMKKLTQLLGKMDKRGETFLYKAPKKTEMRGAAC